MAAPCRKVLALFTPVFTRQLRCYCSNIPKLTNTEVRKKRCEIYNKEKERQQALITRIEKIKVIYEGIPENCTLIMNKKLSTPYNCAMHINEFVCNKSVVALVNGKLWDMHRPLTSDCTLQLLHFKSENPGPRICNEIFWRSSSFLLGHIIETAFKDKYYVELCSFPKPNVRKGSFVYDADIKIGDWIPSEAELRSMRCSLNEMFLKGSQFERLDVDASIANKIFEDNRFKSTQVDNIAARSETGHTVTLYRVGDHIDMSTGPMINSVSQIGRFDVAALHHFEDSYYGPLTRVQGLALPKDFMLTHYTYNFILERAKEFNKSLPAGAYQKMKVETNQKESEESKLGHSRWVGENSRNALN